MRIQQEGAVSRLVSTQTKVKQLEALLGTKDLNEWEQGFVESLAERARSYENLSAALTLSEKQLDLLDRLYRKHFA